PSYYIPPPPLSTLFPYTTLFRSASDHVENHIDPGAAGQPRDFLTEVLRAVVDRGVGAERLAECAFLVGAGRGVNGGADLPGELEDRKSTRLNSSHVKISYAVFCL